MSVAIFIATAFGSGVAVGAVCGYVGGRRSSREELTGAHELIEAMNAAPSRDDLAEVALPPERTGGHPTGPYDWATEPAGDDPWQGSLSYLAEGPWAPAAPTPRGDRP